MGIKAEPTSVGFMRIIWQKFLVWPCQIVYFIISPSLFPSPSPSFFSFLLFSFLFSLSFFLSCLLPGLCQMLYLVASAEPLSEWWLKWTLVCCLLYNRTARGRHQPAVAGGLRATASLVSWPFLHACKMTAVESCHYDCDLPWKEEEELVLASEGKGFPRNLQGIWGTGSKLLSFIVGEAEKSLVRVGGEGEHGSL